MGEEFAPQKKNGRRSYHFEHGDLVSNGLGPVKNWCMEKTLVLFV